MTAAEAKATIAALAAHGRIRFSAHARERMSSRNITPDDVRNALEKSTSCEASSDGADRWIVRGPDLDGEDTKVVCVIESNVIVITVF